MIVRHASGNQLHRSAATRPNTAMEATQDAGTASVDVDRAASSTPPPTPGGQVMKSTINSDLVRAAHHPILSTNPPRITPNAPNARNVPTTIDAVARRHGFREAVALDVYSLGRDEAQVWRWWVLRIVRHSNGGKRSSWWRRSAAVRSHTVGSSSPTLRRRRPKVAPSAFGPRAFWKRRQPAGSSSDAPTSNRLQAPL